MKRRVADIIMDILIANNINDCFAVVGGGAMYLNNALALNKKMHTVFNHNEQACAMAAEAYSRFSGKTAVVCVTSGPGATNTLTGVMGAWQDSLPMIVISGQVRYQISIEKSGLALRYRGIQEFNIVPTVKHMTKYAVMITDPLSIKKEIYKALNIALDGRRGPVWIDVPQDIQSAVIEEEDLYEIEEYVHNYPYIQIDSITAIMSKSKRPCILAGSGIRSGDVMSEFLEFVKFQQIPVIGGSWVADIMYMEHPLFFGLSGNLGPRTGNFILQNSDVILVLGCSLGFRQTGFNQEGFAPNAKIIMVDADENEPQKPGLNIALFVHSDLKSFFKIFNGKRVITSITQQWVDYCNSLKQRFSVYEALENLDMDGGVNSYYFWKLFEKHASSETIVALGNNTANTAKLQIGIQKMGQRVITNYTCGSMGYDIPAAIGSAVASGKNVICITGDGSIMMNLQELQTIKHYNLPINIVVFSNDGYAAIRQTSKNFFNGVYIGCTKETGVSFPNFELVAKTFGFEYVKCSTNRELIDTIDVIFKFKNRIFLEIEQMLDNPVVPKLMSRVDENGNMLTPELHDMTPFLSKEQLDYLMFN